MPKTFSVSAIRRSCVSNRNSRALLPKSRVIKLALKLLKENPLQLREEHGPRRQRKLQKRERIVRVYQAKIGYNDKVKVSEEA
jgi:hypothetical protein